MGGGLSAAPLPRTSYDGQTITYDDIGNPKTYKGATLEWNGRQLVSYTKGRYHYDIFKGRILFLH